LHREGESLVIQGNSRFDNGKERSDSREGRERKEAIKGIKKGLVFVGDLLVHAQQQQGHSTALSARTMCNSVSQFRVFQADERQNYIQRLSAASNQLIDVINIIL
jgi:hypothetical protein